MPPHARTSVQLNNARIDTRTFAEVVQRVQSTGSLPGPQPSSSGGLPSGEFPPLKTVKQIEPLPLQKRPVKAIATLRTSGKRPSAATKQSPQPSTSEFVEALLASQKASSVPKGKLPLLRPLVVPTAQEETMMEIDPTPTPTIHLPPTPTSVPQRVLSPVHEEVEPTENAATDNPSVIDLTATPLLENVPKPQPSASPAKSPPANGKLAKRPRLNHKAGGRARREACACGLSYMELKWDERCGKSQTQTPAPPQASTQEPAPSVVQPPVLQLVVPPVLQNQTLQPWEPFTATVLAAHNALSLALATTPIPLPQVVMPPLRIPIPPHLQLSAPA